MNNPEMLVCGRPFPVECMWCRFYVPDTYTEFYEDDEEGEVCVPGKGNCHLHSPKSNSERFPTVNDDDWCGDFSISEYAAINVYQNDESERKRNGR